MRGDAAPGSPSPHPTASSPGRRGRAGTHGGNSQGPTFSRSFINQNRPCHKKQGPFPQKYDFAKRKSCWLRGCVWWKNFVCFFFSFFFFSFPSFLFVAHFFVIVGCCCCFYKTLALKDSNTVQTATTNPHPWDPRGAGDSGASLGFFCGCFPCPFPGVWRRWAGAGPWSRWNLYSSYVGRWSQERIPE